MKTQNTTSSFAVSYSANYGQDHFNYSGYKSFNEALRDVKKMCHGMHQPVSGNKSYAQVMDEHYHTIYVAVLEGKKTKFRTLINDYNA